MKTNKRLWKKCNIENHRQRWFSSKTSVSHHFQKSPSPSHRHKNLTIVQVWFHSLKPFFSTRLLFCTLLFLEILVANWKTSQKGGHQTSFRIRAFSNKQTILERTLQLCWFQNKKEMWKSVKVLQVSWETERRSKEWRCPDSPDSTDTSLPSQTNLALAPLFSSSWWWGAGQEREEELDPEQARRARGGRGHGAAAGRRQTWVWTFEMPCKWWLWRSRARCWGPAPPCRACQPTVWTWLQVLPAPNTPSRLQQD